MTRALDYAIDHTTVTSGFDGETCWVQATVGAIPAHVTGDAHPTAIACMQKLLLTGSDVFYALHTSRSTDMGDTWTPLEENKAFRRDQFEDGRSRCVGGMYPQWHVPTQTLLSTGHTVYYSPENKIQPGYRPRETPYSVYDPQAHDWLPFGTAEMPDDERFYHAGAGNCQRIDLENGQILLPFYFGLRKNERPSLSAVMRCRYDGRTLQYIEHGSELTCPVKRGFVEPSLTRFNGRYFLSLRNDLANHVAAGDDGLHFDEPIECRFDDGEPLGSYNTQQHWVTHSDGLFLVYTRKGLNNDNVFRHRAPLMMAQFDPERLRIIRDTERELVPNRGARLGNFDVCDMTENETWVIAAEWMQPRGCEQYGSDNTVWIARIKWDRPNALFVC